MNENLNELEKYLNENKIHYEIKGNNLTKIILYDEEGSLKDKFLLCRGLNGNIFHSNKSIWVSELEKNFLEKYKYKVLFSISVRWYFSEVKKFEASKQDGYQCLVDFNQLKFIKKSKNKEKFVHLHNHFEFSQLDGTLNAKQWIENCEEKGFTSLALTDHGTLAGSLDFYLESQKNKNVKSILGYEAYITDAIKLSERGYDHLTLLAKNNLGWRTLLKLNTFAQTTGFYYKPRLTYEFLKIKNKGLIILTGCATGRFSKLLVNKDFEAAEKLYKFYCSCVGEEDVYLELQNHTFNNEKDVEKQNEFFNSFFKIKKILLSKGFNPKIVLTNDCHYPNDEDYHVWNAVNKISSVMEDEKNSCEDLFLKTRKELFSEFKSSVIYKDKLASIKDFQTWCNNTIKISDKCNVTIPIGKHNLPEYPFDKNKFKDKEELFGKIIEEGFLKKIKGKFKNINVYEERIKKEKNVIIKAGFIDYFLIIWDMIKAAKNNGVYVGAARGSVAGSLVAYCMDITDINPIPFNLIFERFLNETRVTSAALYEIEFDGGKKIQKEGSDGIIYKDGRLGEIKDLNKNDEIDVW